MAPLDVVRQLPRPCHTGLVITVNGFIPSDCVQFSINLSTSPTYLGGDIAIHVNPRFCEGNIFVLNSFERDGWQAEERNIPVVPLQKNANFQCTITSLQDKFLIGFNGQNCLEFRHRFCQERARWIIVLGVHVCSVNFDSQSSIDVRDVVRQMPGPCHPGLVITVEGFIPADCIGFSINLSTSPTWLCGDVAIHVNPRFCEGNVLVLNSFERGCWQTEERNGPDVPLQKNANFQCTITSLQDKFLIAFNGQNYGEFRHRFCQDRAKWLIIRGIPGCNANFGC